MRHTKLIMTQISFTKMHGAGNDFIILDAQMESFDLTPSMIKKLSDRHFGIGCDQLIVLDDPKAVRADVFMRIYNQDGSQIGVCGNANFDASVGLCCRLFKP